MTAQYCEAFCAIVDAAQRLGVGNISLLPGCWEWDIDGVWWLAINGHREPMACSHGNAVPPFHAYVEFNGWPAGIFSPSGGEFVAGSAGNEDSFIAALKATGCANLDAAGNPA